MPNIKTALEKAALLEKVSETARLDCELLLSHTLCKGRAYLYTWPEKELTSIQQQYFNELMARRIQGEPIAYITGQKEFWSLPLNVDNTTLIPRPETELLVETALDLFPNDGLKKTVLDLGTGTGAIALALAKERPNWQLVAVDKYPEALALAKSNQQILGLANVRFQQSNWFESLDVQYFDLVVANPPYIDFEDKHLQQGDVRFEPSTALVAANQGLADLLTIIENAPSYLVENAWLLMEHGYEQGSAVVDAMKEQGFASCQSKKDLAGQWRISLGQNADGVRQL